MTDEWRQQRQMYLDAVRRAVPVEAWTKMVEIAAEDAKTDPSAARWLLQLLSSGEREMIIKIEFTEASDDEDKRK